MSGALLRLLRGGPRETPDELGPVGRLAEQLIAGAVSRRASDLHLDPDRRGTRVRYRVDGVFEQAEPLPAELHERLVARIKVLAGLTVYEHESVQEGAIRRPDGVELRVSVLPTVAGEKLSLRVFDPAARPFTIEKLGFESELATELARLCRLQQGVLVVCGPAGSGKTTTLYTLLARLRAERGDWANLCSVEDPVEFALEGVHQVPVRRERGLGFARALSALLRQDPQVILVGEVRDRETAEIAIEAGLTGHLVLTSLHAGSSTEAISRLLDLGIEAPLVASSLKAVLSQRLLRRRCTDCNADTAAVCPRCQGRGHLGRLPVAELLPIDEEARQILRSGRPETLERRLWRGRTLAQAGRVCLEHGLTSARELERVLGLGGEP